MTRAALLLAFMPRQAVAAPIAMSPVVSSLLFHIGGSGRWFGGNDEAGLAIFNFHGVLERAEDLCGPECEVLMKELENHSNTPCCLRGDFNYEPPDLLTVQDMLQNHD